MSTKMTGLDDLGMVTTAGDTGTLATDGSLVIGNADTDNVVFNADIASNIIPDAPNTYDLGTPDKVWKELHLGTRIQLHSNGTPNAIGVVWSSPFQNVQITIPSVDGILAVEGLLPSYLTFGKNGSQSAPLTDYELTTINGAQNAQGWRMPVDGLVTNLSVQFDVTAQGNQTGFLVSLWKNGVQQIGYDIAMNGLASGDNGKSLAFPAPLQFAANDRLTLKMSLTENPPSVLTVNDLACLLRILN